MRTTLAGMDAVYRIYASTGLHNNYVLKMLLEITVV